MYRLSVLRGVRGDDLGSLKDNCRRAFRADGRGRARGAVGAVAARGQYGAQVCAIAGATAMTPQTRQSDKRPRIAQHARRMKSIRDKPAHSPLRGIGTFGMIGWSIAVPTVGGAYLGRWLDRCRAAGVFMDNRLDPRRRGAGRIYRRDVDQQRRRRTNDTVRLDRSHAWSRGGRGHQCALLCGAGLRDADRPCAARHPCGFCHSVRPCALRVCLRPAGVSSHLPGRGAFAGYAGRILRPALRRHNRCPAELTRRRETR